MRRELLLPALAAVALIGAPRPAAAQVKVCKTGSVVVGNPNYQGTDRPPPTGNKATADPALGARAMVFKGKTLYTSSGEDIWAADLASGALRRVAGQHSAKLTFTDGPCDQARFQNIHGLAMLPDGSIIVSDFAGGALLKISSPDDPAACKVAYHAGTSAAVDGQVRQSGDADGPPGTGKLLWPEWPVADAAGNVYVIDSTTSKLRKVAPDRTLSTVTTLPGGGNTSYEGLTLLGGKLYAINNTANSSIVTEIDPATGKTRKLFEGTYRQILEISPNTAPVFSAITSDGKDLFVTGSGFIWRLTTAGKLTHIAGRGSPLNLPPKFDLAATHPAKDLVLRIRNGDAGTIGTLSALAYHDGSLFYRGRADGVYVVKIDCK